MSFQCFDVAAQFFQEIFVDVHKKKFKELTECSDVLETRLWLCQAVSSDVFKCLFHSHVIYRTADQQVRWHQLVGC